MKIVLTHPLISCICITDNRPEKLLRSIICFDTQNYPNRELVISYPKEDTATKNMVSQIIKRSELRILIIERSVKSSIGNARNEAIAKCNGDYFCIWDDDDWYDSKRIIHQFNSIKVQGKYYKASILNQIMIYDATKDNAYLSFSPDWSGSLLCEKSYALKYPYEDSNITEGNNLITFLASRQLLLHVSDCAFLYLYIYHGQNVHNYVHFSYFVGKSDLLDLESLDWIKSLISKDGIKSPLRELI
jgi:glycosyltransferase involved in cell wall biosynthesis